MEKKTPKRAVSPKAKLPKSKVKSKVPKKDKPFELHTSLAELHDMVGFVAKKIAHEMSFGEKCRVLFSTFKVLFFS